MISSPPSFIDIKNGFKSSFDFIRRKSDVDNLFELDIEKFWQSCWIVFFINAKPKNKNIEAGKNNPKKVNDSIMKA